MSLSELLIIVLIEQSSIVTALSISVIFFLVLLILGLRKSYILRKESDKLSETFTIDTEDEKKVYKDFTEGHMYDNNH
ncbi:hypothetical protein LX78_01103 [Xanthomarina spongicola]|uniref:Uncharacterized protein n=2 Tax=Xanthomarina spongicola TaxID=570520 RepID=A0A316DT32_9FLAO|nr:hypothetical protein LX78_01103 [Xanthomarina spongicola]